MAARRGRQLRSRVSSKRGNLKWISSWLDPIATLTPGLTGAAIATTNASLADMTSPTLVGGFVDLTAGVRNAVVDNDGSAGYLIVGLRVLPATLTTISEMPDPFNEDEGSWFWYRSLPMMNHGENGADTGGTVASVRVHDQIRSKRRIGEDEQISLVYTWLDADYTVNDAYCDFLFTCRLLFRER